jgi:hypothetical protein
MALIDRSKNLDCWNSWSPIFSRFSDTWRTPEPPSKTRTKPRHINRILLALVVTAIVFVVDYFGYTNGIVLYLYNATTSNPQLVNPFGNNVVVYTVYNNV